MAPKKQKNSSDYGSPNMSDTTLLVKVEDLINMAMGPYDQNLVNYKLIQTVLHILARQMRMLEQRVEIRISDERESRPEPPEQGETSREDRRGRSKPKVRKEDKEAKDREKAERAISKEREKAEKAERAPSKDREKAERAVSKEREKAEKEAEEGERAAAKDREKAERAVSKEREKAEKEAAKRDRAASKEREKAEKEKDKEERAASRERDKADKAASKDKEKADRAASKEREKEAKAAEKDAKAAEKDAKAAEKAAEKGDKAAKEKEKVEKAAAKEKERDDKAAAKSEKEKQKAGKADAKEREKAAKVDAKEKEKAGQAGAKVKEKVEKAGVKEKEIAAAKEREEALAKEKEPPKRGKKGDTGMVVSEVDRRKEKVLIVEKGPTTRADQGREGKGIEVVTRSQFELVEALVRELQQRAGPLPPPALPDNRKLRDDLAKGQASLTDTMQAMQVTARVQAAEQAIGRLGELLTALAAAGALPEDMADQLEDAKFEPPQATDGGVAAVEGDDISTALPTKKMSVVSRKSVAIDPLTTPSAPSRPSLAGAGSRVSLAQRRASTASRASLASGIGMPGVTHPEMDEAIRNLQEDLSKNVTIMTAKATAVAENAAASVKAVADKLDIALMLDSRISTLYSVTSDYAEQLSGFDAGLTTQMTSFRDQLLQMRTELKAGLVQLEQVNNNAETAAVLELTERYDGLVTELDHTMHEHRTLTSFQKQLGDELQSLVECVEMLREQKADRDEVLDGLRDKADNARLAGLLTALEFSHARLELEKRLDVCHDKFRRQELVWMSAIRDLTNITEDKAEITQLLAAREQAENMLRELQDMQMKLAVILGEPKAAMLTRALSKGASCGSCLTPALMEPQDRSYGAPPALPALRPRDDEPCEPDWKPPEPPDYRQHTCHRWVGGSHTLLSDAITRAPAPPLPQGAPTKRYTGYGSDGRLYMMEDELQPCMECNRLSDEVGDEPATVEQGAGDADLGVSPPLPPTD